MKWRSNIMEVGELDLPEYTGSRVLVMPILLHDIDGSLPSNLSQYKNILERMVGMSPCKEGTGYLTIDEGRTQSDKPQRRPGLHVDAWHMLDHDSEGGDMWGRQPEWEEVADLTYDNNLVSTLMVASHVGCAAYLQEFEGSPIEFGNCEHLREQCKPTNRVELQPNIVYFLNEMTVHESIPSGEVNRQFVRITLPGDMGWPEGATPNPMGIKHEGDVKPCRLPEFIHYGN